MRRPQPAPIVTVLFGAVALFFSIVLPAQVSDPGQSVEDLGRVDLTLRPVSPDVSLPERWELTLAEVNGDNESEAMAFEGATAHLALPPKTQWLVQAEVAANWTAPLIVRVPGVGETNVVTLDLWPASTVAGTLSGTDVTGDDVLSVLFETPLGAKKRIVRAKTACLVSEQHRFSCPIPATRLDLLVRLEGFTPIYRRGIRVPSTKPLDLGSLRLKKGSSLVGFAVVPEGKIDPKTAVARLIPMESASAREAETTASALSGTVLPDGFFQITGVPPGRYAVQVEQPGYAPAKVFPVDVWPDKETALRDPLELQRPTQLTLHFDPVADVFGEPWKVRLFRASDQSRRFESAPVFDGLSDLSGSTVIGSVRPGRFMLEVFDSAGNRVKSDDTFRVEAGAHSEHVIEIEALWIEGTILFGDEPIEARLWFGGRHGSVHSELASDEDGQFEGLLARDGRWRVEVEAPELDLSVRTRVEVPEPKNGKSRVEIEVPNTHVYGTVVNEHGTPVEGARVELGTLGTNQFCDSDASGRFSLRGASEGIGMLEARIATAEGRASSDPVRAVVTEANPTGPITLELRSLRQVSGLVVSPRGPVAGAEIKARVVAPAYLGTGSARTGADGTFTMQLPSRGTLAHLVVIPPGYALTTAEVQLGENPIEVPVGWGAGELNLLLPPNVEEKTGQGFSYFLFHEGRAVSLSAVYTWATGLGLDVDFSSGSIRVPSVAPGRYQWCLGKTAMGFDRAEFETWLQTETECADGIVDAGAVLVLDHSRAEAPTATP